jgi:hypothetical protein
MKIVIMSGLLACLATKSLKNIPETEIWGVRIDLDGEWVWKAEMWRFDVTVKDVLSNADVVFLDNDDMTQSKMGIKNFLLEIGTEIPKNARIIGISRNQTDIKEQIFWEDLYHPDKIRKFLGL